MTYVLTREFQPDQLGLHSWGRSNWQLGQISSFGLVSWAWPKGFHFGPAASFQQFYSRCFSTRNFCLLGRGSGSVAQLHSGTGDNMNDREAAVGQRKVSENRLSMFPGRCGRVKEQCHTSQGQTVQDTKECGQERASELISVTIPEASGRCQPGESETPGGGCSLGHIYPTL